MNYQEFVKKGLLRKEKIDFKQINQVIIRAYRDLKSANKVVVEFTKKVLGKNFEVLTKKFDKIRKKRNYLIYGTGLAISKTEAENSIKTAEEFIGIVEKIIRKRNPQKRLI